MKSDRGTPFKNLSSKLPTSDVMSSFQVGRALKARESMLPDYHCQAVTSIWLPASLSCAAIKALLHCLVFPNHFSDIDLERFMLSDPKALTEA